MNFRVGEMVLFRSDHLSGGAWIAGRFEGTYRSKYARIRFLTNPKMDPNHCVIYVIPWENVRSASPLEALAAVAE